MIVTTPCTYHPTGTIRRKQVYLCQADPQATGTQSLNFLLMGYSHHMTWGAIYRYLIIPTFFMFHTYMKGTVWEA